MADPDRKAAAVVAFFRSLELEPHAFDFFEVMRRLECLFPELPRLAQSARLAEEPIRLGQEPSLAFAPAALSAVERGHGGAPPRLLVRFLGLFGPNGPLPLHLTEYARDRLRNADDATFSRFADIFHHRLLCLFYRAWAKARPTVHLDRPASDRFATYVGSCFGIGAPELQHRDALPDLAKLYYAGRFACPTRHAEGLAAVLTDFLRLPGWIEEFSARWVNLPEECVCRLGESVETGALGVTAIVGARVWDCAQTFRVVLGPMGLGSYERLLPGGTSLGRLAAVVRNYVGDELGWEVQLLLKQEEIPPLTLGRYGRLGWTTWLATAARDRDAGDLVLAPHQTWCATGGGAA